MTLLNSPFDANFEHGTGFQKDLVPDGSLVVYPGDVVRYKAGATVKNTVERFTAADLNGGTSDAPTYVVVSGNSVSEHNPTKYVAGVKKGITFITERYKPSEVGTFNAGDLVMADDDDSTERLDGGLGFSWAKHSGTYEALGKVIREFVKEGVNVLEIEKL